MIRQCIDKIMEALRRAVDRSKTIDEILLGAILAFVLVIIMASMDLFD